MKKILVLLVLMLFVAGGTAFATDKIRVSPEVYSGITKYKQGDYTSCIQLMQKAETTMKDASIPYYYMGNAYVQLNRVEDAKGAYQKVIELNSNLGLVALSKNAVEYLNDTEAYAKKDDMGTFIKSKKFLHPDVIKKFEDKEIDNAKQEINSKTNKEDYIDFSKYKYLNDAKGQMPTDEEIATAVKTLARVGFNPYAMQNYNSDYQALNMMNGNNQNMNDFANILPYLMAQSNQNSNSNMNNQLMQQMMLRGMTQGF